MTDELEFGDHSDDNNPLDEIIADIEAGEPESDPVSDDARCAFFESDAAIELVTQQLRIIMLENQAVARGKEMRAAKQRQEGWDRRHPPVRYLLHPVEPLPQR